MARHYLKNGNEKVGHIHVSLYPSDVAKAKMLGKGNVSAGIRLAVEKAWDKEYGSSLKESQSQKK